MKKITIYEIISLCLLLSLPFIYLALTYNSLPLVVATHFDLAGKADGFSERSSLWIHLIILSVVATGVYALVTQLPAIDPKQKASPRSQSSYRKTGFAVVILITAINFTMVYDGQPHNISGNRLLFIFLGLFFVFLGNQMNSMKPNYFVGIRIPWTLDSEDNWRATHRLGGRTFMIGGALLILTAIFLSVKVAGISLMVITASMTLIPIIYSLVYFMRHSKQPKS